MGISAHLEAGGTRRGLGDQELGLQPQQEPGLRPEGSQHHLLLTVQSWQ